MNPVELRTKFENLGEYGIIDKCSGEFIFKYCSKCGGPVIGHSCEDEVKCSIPQLEKDEIEALEILITSDDSFESYKNHLDDRIIARTCEKCNKSFKNRAVHIIHQRSFHRNFNMAEWCFSSRVCARASGKDEFSL